MLLMMIVMLFPILGLALFWFLPVRSALPYYLAGLAASGLLHHLMMRASRLPVRTGPKGMIGRPARVLEWEGDGGWVQCQGERWRAVAQAGCRPPPDGHVRVAGIDRLTLVVEPLPQGHGSVPEARAFGRERQ